MKKYKAVLFDFDGVIGKTMEDNYRAWKSAFSKYGISFDKNEYFLLEGITAKKVAEHFLKKSRKTGIAADVLVQSKEKQYAADNSFKLYAGAERLLSFLKKNGYRRGLVSGSSYKRIMNSLTKKLIKNFEVIVTGDMVARCKPYPDQYLCAAKKLSLKTSCCLAVENAPLGIAAAKSAGMKCVAVSSTLDKKYLKKADAIIDRLTELKKYL